MTDTFQYVWSKYRKSLLERIPPAGIHEAELRKASGLSDSQFYRVMAKLEKKCLVRRAKVHPQLCLIFPTKSLLFLLQHHKTASLEFWILDFDDSLMRSDEFLTKKLMEVFGK